MPKVRTTVTLDDEVLRSVALGRALASPKLRRHVMQEDAHRLVRWLRGTATVAEDPGEAPPVRSPDRGDDHLIALAASRQALLVGGDRHLLDLADRIPVLAPARFRQRLAEPESEHDN